MENDRLIQMYVVIVFVCLVYIPIWLYQYNVSMLLGEAMSNF